MSLAVRIRFRKLIVMDRLEVNVNVFADIKSVHVIKISVSSNCQIKIIL